MILREFVTQRLSYIADLAIIIKQFNFMKNYSSIICGLFFLTQIHAYSQNQNLGNKLRFGFKAGNNFSNVQVSQTNEFASSGKFGMAAGLYLGYPVGRLLGFQTEVLFSQKGYKTTGTLSGNKFNLTRISNFIDVPLLISINAAKFMTVQFGPQFSYLANQKDTFSDSSVTVEQQSLFSNNTPRKNIFSFTGGIDFNLKTITIGTRAGIDIQNNNGDGSIPNPRYKNIWLQATLGVNIF